MSPYLTGNGGGSSCGSGSGAALGALPFAISEETSRPTRVPRRKSFTRQVAAIVLLVTMSIAAASPAFADRYDKKRAGHPLRIAAYVLYPVGALIDVLLVRPAHWLISQEPFKSAVGHED